MNKEFTVEPTAFENSLQLKYLLEKFGFTEGRLLVSFPSNWVKQVYDHVVRFPDIEQQRAKRLIEKAKEQKAIVKPSRAVEFHPGLEWTRNVAIANQNKDVFHRVIASNSNPFGFPTIDEVDADFFGSWTDVRCEGLANNYVDLARRLLSVSNELLFIDPYLDLLRPSREKVIKAMIRGAGGGNKKEFVVWARDSKVSQKSATQYRDRLSRIYDECLGLANIRLRVKLVDDADSAQKMHSRLLLSRYGGMRFDHGFEEFEDGRFVDVSILSGPIHSEYYEFFVKCGADYKVIEEHICPS